MVVNLCREIMESDSISDLWGGVDRILEGSTVAKEPGTAVTVKAGAPGKSG
jgi:hypothetical protein